MFKNEIKGVVAAIAAFLAWGLFPVFWKSLDLIPSLELLAHRVVWSLIFIGSIIFFTTRTKQIKQILLNKKTMTILILTSALIAINWFVFIWAVNNGHVISSSLGYYINPLLNVVFGTVFLDEHLNRKQIIAVTLAGIGVLILIVFVGGIPWIALILAGSFGGYGLLRKKLSVGSITGFGVESLILSLPAVMYLSYLGFMGTGSFGTIPWKYNLLLVLSGVVTALPLVWFAYAVRRLRLSTIGFIHYLAPTCMFLLGLFIYQEEFSVTYLITFIFIWSGLAIYSIDSVKTVSKSLANPTDQRNGVIV